jgi:hypothetical protein
MLASEAWPPLTAKSDSAAVHASQHTAQSAFVAAPLHSLSGHFDTHHRHLSDVSCLFNILQDILRSRQDHVKITSKRNFMEFLISKTVQDRPSCQCRVWLL